MKLAMIIEIARGFAIMCSLLQALELSDGALTKLGLARENVDDTATAAQV